MKLCLGIDRLNVILLSVVIQFVDVEGRVFNAAFPDLHASGIVWNRSKENLASLFACKSKKQRDMNIHTYIHKYQNLKTVDFTHVNVSKLN